MQISNSSSNRGKEKKLSWLWSERGSDVLMVNGSERGQTHNIWQRWQRFQSPHISTVSTFCCLIPGTSVHFGENWQGVFQACLKRVCHSTNQLIVSPQGFQTLSVCMPRHNERERCSWWNPADHYTHAWHQSINRLGNYETVVEVCQTQAAVKLDKFTFWKKKGKEQTPRCFPHTHTSSCHFSDITVVTQRACFSPGLLSLFSPLWTWVTWPFSSLSAKLISVLES